MLTPQTSNGAESSSAWPSPDPWSGGSSANLHPPIFTPHRSSATQSEYSGSAWEPDPGPSADDGDLRPTPDNNSASMQSYNDPRTGIWSQENVYRQGIRNTATRNMRHDHVIDYTVTQLIPQDFQQFLADVEAAAPFGTDSFSNGGILSTDPSLSANGRPEMAAPSSLPPFTDGGPVSQLFQPPIRGRSGVSMVIDGTMNFETSSAQQPLQVERSTHPLGSDHISLLNLANRISLDDPHLPPTNLPPTMSIEPPTTTGPPQISADTSPIGIVRCTERGCQAKFTGDSWKDSLRRHMTGKHRNKPKPTCSECHMVFQSGRRDNLKRHIMDKHPGHPLPPSRSVLTKGSTPKPRRP